MCINEAVSYTEIFKGVYNHWTQSKIECLALVSWLGMKEYYNNNYIDICNQICQKPPYMHRMAKNGFHCQSRAPSIN